MEKIKLFIVFSAAGFGGLPRNVSLIASKLDPARFEVHVGMLTDPSDTQADLRSYVNFRRLPHVQFHQIGNGSTLELAGLREMRRIINEKRIDVLSCHGYKADVFGGLLRLTMRRRFGLVSVAHGWGVSSPKLKLYYFLDRKILRRFDKIVFLTEEQVDELRWKGIPAAVREVIPNGIDLELYIRLPDREAARKALSLPLEAPLLGYVGRLGREKNIEDTVRALRAIVDKVPQTRLVLVGDGPAQTSIMAVAETLGVYDRIIPLGYIQDVRLVYAALDVFVSNSVHEGLPNSVLEALAAGVPCVLSDIAGHRSVVTDGVNGFLFRLTDHQRCASRVIELLQNPTLARTCAISGKELIDERYSLTHRIERLESVYTEAAQKYR